MSFAVIFTNSENREMIFSAGIGEGQGGFSAFVFVRVDGEPLSFIEVEPSDGGDFRSFEAKREVAFFRGEFGVVGFG